VNDPVLSIESLDVTFTTERLVSAVRGVSLTLAPGRVLCIIGESGSGKSVTLQATMRLLPPASTRYGGRIMVCGQDVLAMRPAALRALRGQKVAMIFQEPMSALDPVYSIGQMIGEVLRMREGIGHAAARARAVQALELVQVPDAARRVDAYPHELSGGLRQRAMIALAIASRPRVLLADEPTTALDATVQIQVLLLLRRLRAELGMAMVFVTHDLGVAAEIADEVAVMYAGQVVESGSVGDILRAPMHPYTRALISSSVQGAAAGARLATISGAPPDPGRLPPGCAFAPRCPAAVAACAVKPPSERHGNGRMIRCDRVEFDGTVRRA
jgi:peptide/nickel transport system ATP-binding protein